MCAANKVGPGNVFRVSAFAPPLEDWTNFLRSVLAFGN
ncbi:protein of unknown function (plasmid) [Caballeronia sp. S22]